jgi:hypothetical protein
MAFITVKRLSTSNTTPTLTGTVEFERFDSSGKPKESFEVYVNYVPYRLFEGNLGLDETKTPNQWKLQFESKLFPGTYDVEATVFDVNTKQILASDDSKDELIIIAPPRGIPSDNSFKLRERYARLSLLMNSLNTLFGGSNGLTPLPSVHPTLDDQSTTALPAKGNQERAQDPRDKSKDKVRMKDVPLPPKKSDFFSTDPGSGTDANDMDWELASLDQARDAVGELDTSQSVEAAANEAVRSAPDTAAEAAQFQFSSTPTSSTG